MIQTFVSRWSLSGAGTSNRGSHPFVGQHAQLNAGTQQVNMPISGTLRNFYVRSDTAFSSGTNQVGLYINGSLTALTGTIQTGTQEFLVTTDVAITAGQTLEIRANYSNAPMPHVLQISFDFENPSATTSLYGFGGSLDNVDGTYEGLMYSGGLQAWDVSPSGLRNTASLSGFFTELRVRIGTAPGGSNTRTWVIYKNDVIQNGSGGTVDTRLTLSGASTTGFSTFSLAVEPQDILYIGHTVTGSPTTFNVSSVGTSLFQGPADAWMMGSTSNAGPSGTSVNYQAAFGNVIGLTYSGVESSRVMINGSDPFTVTGFWVQIDNPPGMGSSWTFTLRVNGVDTDLNVVIADNNTIGFDSGTAVINTGDEVVVSVTPTNNPLPANQTNWTFTIGEPIQPPNPDNCECAPPGTPGTPEPPPPDEEIIIPEQLLCACGGTVPEQAYSPFVETWWGIGL